MRKIFQVFATVFLVSLLAGAVLMIQINSDWAAKVTEMRSDVVTRFLVEAVRDDIPEASAFSRAVWIWVAIAVMVPLGIYGVYWRKHLPALVMMVVMIAAVVASVLLQPGMELPKGNDPKTMGIGIAFFGIIGLLMGVLLHTTMKGEEGEEQMYKLY